MPQARLPDINTQYIKFVNESVNSWKSKAYDSCLGAIHCINALLPEDYRVQISDQKYLDASKEQIFAKCHQCDEETNRQDIEIFQVLLNFEESVMMGAKSKEIWVCPKCKKESDVLRTEFVSERFQDPTYFQVVPQPPRHTDGLIDRTSFHKKFTVWFWTMLGELGNQMAKFRDDNWTKEEVYADLDDIDGGEEKE